MLLEEEYCEWKVKYEEASTDLMNRETRVKESIDLLEHDMELLGITGVEDKL